MKELLKSVGKVVGVAGNRAFRIVVVEGPEPQACKLRVLLEEQGWEVSITGAAEALAALSDSPPDLILVDDNLPGISADEFCRRIRGNANTRGVPILITTASAPDTVEIRRLESGADDHISQSENAEILLLHIRALLRRRFVQEENGRIMEEPKARRLEMLRARDERQMAAARACMAEKLVQADHDLQEANQRLKETQAQLIQNDKMASLGQLVAGIAHEINNPLAFVLNNLFLVESSLDGLGPDVEPHLAEPVREKLREARARLGEMREGLDRVKELVLDLRTFSRLDEGKFQPVDVVETIDGVLLLLKHKMNGRIGVEKHYVPARALYCYGGRIHQVLMNLIGNAIDAIAGKGKIVITTSQTPQDFLISVRDTGAGIPANICSKIFDPFFTTKPVGQGTGLGLAISHGIVQDHGGSIEVQSEVGVGTEFVVRIPRHLELQRGK